MAKYEQPTIRILFMVEEDVLSLSASVDPVGNDKSWTAEGDIL